MAVWPLGLPHGRPVGLPRPSRPACLPVLSNCESGKAERQSRGAPGLHFKLRLWLSSRLLLLLCQLEGRGVGCVCVGGGVLGGGGC
jgi:hypothetical protein